MTQLTIRTAKALTRVLLLLYPPAFRHDVGNALVADVHRRAADLAGSRMRTGVWLIRLTISLLANALTAWVEKVPVPRASWLDVKLAVRMLVRQPGLTLVAIFALGIGIPVGLLPGLPLGVIRAGTELAIRHHPDVGWQRTFPSRILSLHSAAGGFRLQAEGVAT